MVQNRKLEVSSSCQNRRNHAYYTTWTLFQACLCRNADGKLGILVGHGPLVDLLGSWGDLGYEEDAVAGGWDGKRIGPAEAREGSVSLVLLASADEQGEAAGWPYQLGRGGQDGGEALDGAEGDYVGWGAGISFRASRDSVDIGQ
jgi:hypothetical protein